MPDWIMPLFISFPVWALLAWGAIKLSEMGPMPGAPRTPFDDRSEQVFAIIGAVCGAAAVCAVLIPFVAAVIWVFE